MQVAPNSVTSVAKPWRIERLRFHDQFGREDVGAIPPSDKRPQTVAEVNLVHKWVSLVEVIASAIVQIVAIVIAAPVVKKMRHVRSQLRSVILAVAVSITPAFAAPWVVEGRAVGISDGDTITVLDDSKNQHKVRIAGIDAPEKGQAFGERSKQNLSALVFEKNVEARCHKKDRYGREVCTVYVARRDVGLEQIRTGMAWHYKAYQHEQTTQERLVYRDEEENAKTRRIDL